VAADAGHLPARYLLAALRGEDDELDDAGEFGDLDDLDAIGDPDDPDGFGHPDDADVFDAFGDPGPEEMREIIEKMLREAWRGDVDAQFGVALAYHLGSPVGRRCRRVAGRCFVGEEGPGRFLTTSSSRGPCRRPWG